ncbi:hypothetical protein [Gordonia sp. 'Campus']|uniref:hypothetical protein n=1 Tax=Gordonia sp. 'Campus' TaxID=2915824 RepID=UPI001EE3D689|nr:hypothetical protein [Gordonia sp. 'Campus']
MDRVSIAGVAVAGLGAAHFCAPQLFAPITQPLFPEDTRGWTYRNGATETAIGAGLIASRTRPVAVAGLAAYLGFLAYRVARTVR